MEERSLTWRWCQTLVRIWTSTTFNFHAYDREHVPESGPALLVSNHQSFLDPILVGVQLYRPVSYMARHTLFQHPISSRLFRALGGFPVQRNTADLSAMKECVRQLSLGNLLTVFPEGTRSESGEIGRIHKGVTLIIRRAAVPVIPVAIHGSAAAWPKSARFPHAHPIRLIYGPPQYLHEKPPEEILTAIHASWRSLLTQLKTKD
jgi:1-acyl-sn-glycerol-3-phosphate acyltransferase